MTKCPCIECLKLAICVTKNEVYCSELANYADRLIDTNGSNFYWKIVTSVLPNLEHVYDDKFHATSYRGL